MVYTPIAYIWLIFMVNVGEYTIHGSYGVVGSHGFPREFHGPNEVG